MPSAAKHLNFSAGLFLPVMQLSEQRTGRLATERGIQDLYCVDNGSLLMLARERRLKLEDAAGISSGDDVGSEVRNEFGFAIAERIGGVGLDKIVDSCGTAADGGFGDLDKLKTWNSREQSARLRAHALRVLQMA